MYLDIRKATSLLGIKKEELFDILGMDEKLKKRFLRKKEIVREDKLPEVVRARAILLGDVLFSAKECFGREKKARSWFHSNIIVFNLERPLYQLHKGIVGIEDVRTIIGQITHGIYS